MCCEIEPQAAVRGRGTSAASSGGAPLAPAKPHSARQRRGLVCMEGLNTRWRFAGRNASWPTAAFRAVHGALAAIPRGPRRTDRACWT